MMTIGICTEVPSRLARSLRPAALALLLAWLAVGCAAAPPPEATPTGTEPPTATTAATLSPGTTGSDGVEVSLADDGGQLALTVGETFLVKLGEEYDWTVTIADQSIVARVPNIMVVRGAQGVYQALAPGSTELSAAGTPVCRQATPACGAPDRLFTLALSVAGP